MKEHLRRALLQITMATVTAFVAVPLVAAPARMLAMVQTSTGLQRQSVATPVPAAGEVLIKVYAAGVNPVDWKRKPQIPGFDAAGIIDRVGPGVTQWKPGDKVAARVVGGYSQYAIANADETIRKPARFTFVQAGGIAVAGIAGYRAANAAHIQPGQRIAIIGAAGGAGSVAVQVAKVEGAHIIASGHSSQQAFLRSLGVNEFVAYDKEDVAARIQNVDAVLNMVDTQASTSLAYVRRGGVFASIAGGPGDGQCAAAGVSCVVITGGYQQLTQGDALRALASLADKGLYGVTITRTFPLAQAMAAQEFGRTGDTIGKIVLVVNPLASTR
jgi:NADPH:quinone reductase-like Zn-dependent oxidoreductase